MDNNKCTYPQCNQQILFPNEDNLCVFHHPENCNITRDKFKELLLEIKIRPNDLNFTGYVFSHYINFEDLKFSLNFPVNFNKCIFKGQLKTKDDIICVDFSNIYLLQADFTECTFEGSVNFIKTEFRDFVLFEHATFSNGKIDFNYAKFNTRLADFRSVIFNSIKIFFHSCQVNQKKGDQVFFGLSNGFLFNNSIFKNTFLSFYNSNISCDILCFDDTEYFNNSTLIFDYLRGNIRYLTFNRIKGGLRWLGFSDAEIKFQEFNIYNSEFNGFFIFQRCKFEKFDDINTMKFYVDNSSFNGAFQITKSIFNKIDLVFNKVSLSSTSNFSHSEFNSSLIFIECTHKGKLNLDRTKFKGEQFTFKNNSFGDILLTFEKMELYSTMEFEDCIFSDNTELQFKTIKFNENSIIHFLNNSLITNCQSDNILLISFDYTDFPQQRTIFEKFKFGDSKNNIHSNIAIIFRYCLLKGVYFINNDMTKFSFYKSIFDEAIFISCFWLTQKDKILKLIRYNRPNIIFEDYIFNNKKFLNNTKLLTEFKLKDLSHVELESMYRRLKTSLDNTKNYWQAGWFYFNEYEMKRLKAKDDRNNNYKSINWFRSGLLYLYKVFAGYGEKPFWSFIWFIVFTLFFSAIHLLKGIHYKGEKFRYILNLNIENLKNHFTLTDIISFIKDFLYSILFTISHILPLSFLNFEKINLNSLNIKEFLLMLSNSIVLLLLVTFIGVGLKRYFRRF